MNEAAWINPNFTDYMARAGLSMPPKGQRIEAIATHETILGYSCCVENLGTHAICTGSAPRDGRGGFRWRQDLLPAACEPTDQTRIHRALGGASEQMDLLALEVSGDAV